MEKKYLNNIQKDSQGYIKNVLQVKKRPLTKSTWHNWLIKYMSEVKNKQWVVLKTKLWAFFKTRQLKILVNQHV